MGNLGFLFRVDVKKQIVVFTFSNKFDGNIIIGDKNLFLKNIQTNYYYLSKNLKLENYKILDDFKYRYSKIKVFNQRIVDFEDFVFYLKPKEYKILKFLFELENFSEDNLIKNTLEIYDYFI